MSGELQILCGFLKYPSARWPSHCLFWFHEPFPLLFANFSCLRVESKVLSRTETLEIGSSAPAFSLGAANREGKFTLSGFLERGPLILEVLRGTW